MKHRKTEGSDTVRSCSVKTFIGTLSNTPLSLSRTIVIEAIADGSVPLETSCLSSTRTRSASCSILDLLDPSCTLSPFSIIILLPNRFDIFDRPCFSLILFFSFLVFLFCSFNIYFFFFRFFFFFLIVCSFAGCSASRKKDWNWKLAGEPWVWMLHSRSPGHVAFGCHAQTSLDRGDTAP